MYEPSTPLLMFISFRDAEQRILNAVTEAGHAVTLGQARVAARIADDGIRLTDLAEQAQVTKQSAGGVIDQLERAGYVERVPDPTDARARLIRLSAAGREMQRLARREEQRIERAWAEHLGPDASARLRDALQELRTLTDPYR